MLICCGLTTLDITQVVHVLPRPDEKVVATSQRATFGGPAANAAATAAALGVPTRLVTAIGTGALAEVVRADVVAAGVELIDVTADGRAVPDEEARGPAVSTVLVTAGTGERAVVSTNATDRPVAAGGGRAVSSVFDPVGQGDVGGRERDVLLLDGHHPFLAHALAVRAREREVLVVLDGGSWKDGTAELVALCDAVVLSQDFRMPGGDVSRVLEDVAALGPRFVARSRGGAPVEVLDGGARSDLPVPAAGVVVDTLGAGDVLHGAFAAGVSRGRSWGSALREAVAVASRSVSYEGARGWIGR
ncbi:carbohydrate kinase [Oerskovia turbata]|uniref:Carbohydrate kinase n=1 Tax=Oerskovia turbata TaxID=1713 RepID=A0A4Q1L1Z3_9CELL|nr:PfkB family carbohydrate kinase [Oerskovia turbata]RXR26239.1 carbohydrate kinase [Oerskovia turbata]RXR36741.1 carbohydrate kinase [Oerskovia turbata]TGJ97431.1 carbohydrate kinase [Actinotalea fermentans ATCC 43279 = JCM 9966 = DSM 3133]